MADMLIPFYLLAGVFLLVAFFYSSVGLGGGSSYTALLALAGVSSAAIPMISLTLNLVVTTLGSLLFFHNRHARFSLVIPFLVSSIPMAYLGGSLHVPKEVFYIVLFVSLIFAAWRIYFPSDASPLSIGPLARVTLCLVAGGVLGLVAGIVGIGGGVYLVPLIIIFGMGSAREAAACGSIFIWVNSMSALIARLQYNSVDLVPYIPLIVAVFAGGMAGAFMGSARFAPRTMERILGSILLAAVCFLGNRIYGIYFS